MAKFTFKNIVEKVDVAAIEVPEVVTISPTLVYNNDYSRKAAAADAVTMIQGGLVRVPVFGSRQFVEIKRGEVFTVNAEKDAEIAFYTNLVEKLADSKVIEAIAVEGVNPAVEAEDEADAGEDA